MIRVDQGGLDNEQNNVFHVTNFDLDRMKDAFFLDVQNRYLDTKDFEIRFSRMNQ